MKSTCLSAAALLVLGLASNASAQSPAATTTTAPMMSKATPPILSIQSVCPARVQALATYETLADVPSPFEKLPLPAALTPDEDVQMRVARSGATGSTIIDIPDADQTEHEKNAIASGTAVRVMRTQPVRVFADTARINAACRVKQ